MINAVMTPKNCWVRYKLLFMTDTVPNVAPFGMNPEE